MTEYRNSDKGFLSCNREAFSFTSIQTTTTHSIRQLPIEMEQHFGQWQLNVGQPEIQSGADPSTCPEWNVFEIIPNKVFIMILSLQGLLRKE